MFKQRNIKIFTISFTILTMGVKGQVNSGDMKRQNQLDADVNLDITDNDLKLALNDLSLNDLKSLKQLIDYADYNYMNYQENSLKNGESNTMKSKEPNNRDVMDYPDQDYYNGFESESSDNDFIHSYKSQLLPESQQRTKRNDEKSDFNEEYIKKLELSFPQNKQQNNDIELIESHIRVKRN